MDIHSKSLLPVICRPPKYQSLAIIIPFREVNGQTVRTKQLNSLIQHLTPLLTRQGSTFRIFLLNQTQRGKFNKGKMMNIGFVEALAKKEFDLGVQITICELSPFL